MCSVNVFGLLTGYLYSERNTYKYISIIRLIFEVIFYSALITILVLFIRPEWITGKKELLESLFPFGTRLWYITAYIFVFCMIPYLNVFIQNCNKTAFRNLLFVLFLLFSLCTTFGLKDFFGIAMGGSCFWLIFMYLIGAYIRMYNIKKRRYSFFILLFSLILLFLLYVAKNTLGFSIINIFYNRLLAYSSPLILFIAVILFIYCKEITINNAFIRKLLLMSSTSSLAVYVIHAHGLILDNIIYKLLQSKLQMNSVLFLLYGFGFVLGIFVICIIIDCIRIKIEKISRFIVFEQKISNIIDRSLNFI